MEKHAFITELEARIKEVGLESIINSHLTRLRLAVPHLHASLMQFSNNECISPEFKEFIESFVSTVDHDSLSINTLLIEYRKVRSHMLDTTDAIRLAQVLHETMNAIMGISDMMKILKNNSNHLETFISGKN